MQAAMIRSELFQNQGALRDALETLLRAIKLSDSPGVKTLRKKITTGIQELERLMRMFDKRLGGVHLRRCSHCGWYEVDATALACSHCGEGMTSA